MSETTVTPLQPSTLDRLTSTVTTPAYDRAHLRPAIVHIGVGGFHRAHLATYVDELAAAGSNEWGIVGIGVLDGDARMAKVLHDQGGLYSLITRSAATTTVQVIGSIIDYVHAPVDRQAAIDAVANPAAQIVSLTITEGGYPVNDLTGNHDSDSPNAGASSAFGIIASGLEARRRAGGGPLTIMSCDNVMSNGKVARAATLGEAARHGNDLTAWIDDHVSFPNSMVDRITPATTDADRIWLASTHSLGDSWPVVTEPFRQWVIEDDFAGDRPPFEQLDVVVTDDVEPYEFMKLRLLNAGHSCLAYLAALMGHTTVDAAVADPSIAGYLARFLHHESKPVLPAVEGIDVDAYIDTTIERFRNPAIGDQIARLCLDGTAKFPKFLLPTVRAQLADGGPIGLSALALAGWCHYLNGRTDDGSTIDVAGDPNLDEAQGCAARSIDDPAAFLDLTVTFGSDLANNDRFRNAFVTALTTLRTHGTEAAIASSLTGSDEHDAD